ncbi:MarR family winged helix-turn-helix transcriptional regulator [Phytobacter sp. V91]|uniref:MarR family winged helix-turn-helix transcriptional regulator n=1 Tax=Phytobacter sp. V91 TaxID=3369425 RepID=UPI003F60478D
MQYAHKNYDVTDFHGALLDIIGVMNHPRIDETLLAAADVKLDQILFPLLITIGRYGPIGVVDLADRVGRDYTTVSRQVKRLQEMALAQKNPGGRDKRISEVTLTAQGEALTSSIASARQILMNEIFADWQEEDVKQLFRLVRQYAQGLEEKAHPKE